MTLSKSNKEWANNENRRRKWNEVKKRKEEEGRVTLNVNYKCLVVDVFVLVLGNGREKSNAGM